MFFSDDLLTGKKGSLGLVWLMATLGPRNTRITRKAITNLDIERTCELISSPPEPMALRLSSHLLYGVARVHHQNCMIFFDDVQNFHVALRRSRSDPTSGLGKRNVGGLDMVGDGISRTDHITFPNNDFSDLLSGIDFDFGGIDWNNPVLPDNRNRRATSKFSIPSQYTDKKQIDDDDDDDLPFRRDRFTTPQPVNSNRPSVAPMTNRADTEGPDEPIQMIDIFNELDNPFDIDMDPISASTITDVGPDVHLNVVEPIIDVDIQPVGHSVDPTVEVDGPIQPEKKKIKTKIKTVQFDDDIEMETQLPGSYAASNEYVQRMRQEKNEKEMKNMENRARLEATLLVDGCGLFLQFTDPDMTAFFLDVSKAPKFKWELDAKAHRDGKRPRSEETPLPAQPNPGDFIHSDLPQEPQQPDAPLVWQPEPVEPPQPDEPPRAVDDTFVMDEMEIPRNVNPMPWSGILNDDQPWSDGPADDNNISTPRRFDVTMTPRRVSIMTPLEIKIRSNTKSVTRPAFRSRTASIASVDLPNLVLVPDDDRHTGSDDDVDDHTGPFSAKLLALLELQCREFLGYIEIYMLEETTQVVELEEIVNKAFDKIEAKAKKNVKGVALLPQGAKRRVAAAAFHNCLTLATKGVLSVDQDEFQGPIPIRLLAPPLE